MFYFFHLLLFFHFLLSSSTPVAGAHPGCLDKCGDITIPYPFGTAAGCYHDPSFQLTCNSNSPNPSKLFITAKNIEITNISLDGTAVITGPVAQLCNKSAVHYPNASIDIMGTPYTFSNTRNRLTGLGCNFASVDLLKQSSSIAPIDFEYDMTYLSSGCTSMCPDKSDIVPGMCGGIGCCQTAIPKGHKMFRTFIIPFASRPQNVTPCNYAFLIDGDQFVFDWRELSSFGSRVPVVVDWAVGNQTCKAAEQAGNLACGVNAYCVNATNGQGYNCICNSGHEGNPYLPDGCQDIDECEDLATTSCAQSCMNTQGGYHCYCPSGFYGDGSRLGTGCSKETKKFPLLHVAIGSGLGLMFVIISSFWIHWGLKKKKLMKMKEMYFEKNGGLLLQEQIFKQGATRTARIFTAEELERATDNYSESRILGRGGYGTVYKGILPDNRAVAIKKSRTVTESQIEQFINEVVILSQVIHRNVVSLLGCCLETQVPLLVYEYVSNGTLHHHIHHQDHISSLSWEARLRIAAETAGALAYLHTATAQPIFHRDVKSANILLDKNYMAKVADFGASRLIPLDSDQITTFVQGTLGYLDPEYFQTGRLTEKSDVYSFGVILAELLTSERPMSSAMAREEQNLALYFLSNMRRNHLFEILEPRVLNEGGREQLLAIAEVTRRCLRMKGEERPTISEVAMELQRLSRQWRSPSVEEGQEEDDNNFFDCSPTQTMYYTA